MALMKLPSKQGSCHPELISHLNFKKYIRWEQQNNNAEQDHLVRVKSCGRPRKSSPVAEGVKPCWDRYWSLKNLLWCLIPLSQRIVTIVWPGPIFCAILTAPTQFIAEELPRKSPSFFSRNLTNVHATIVGYIILDRL